jgi:uncharacterized membrane protein
VTDNSSSTDHSAPVNHSPSIDHSTSGDRSSSGDHSTSGDRSTSDDSASSSDLTSPPRQSARLVWSRRLTWLALGGLVLLFTWLNLAQPEGSFPRWLIQCVPLLLFVPGLLRQSYRSHSWLCFVTLLYFIPASTQVVMSLGYRGAEPAPGHWSDELILLLVVILFFAATLSSRWLQYWYLDLTQGHLQAQTRSNNEQ